MDKFLGKVVDKVVGDDDLHGAASVAAKEAPEDQDFFADIISKLVDKNKQEPDDDIDEQGAVESHRQFFDFGGSSSSSAAQNQPASTSSLGSAAAVQALKLFTSGDSSSQNHGQSQNAFVGLAMAQAAKLFDAQASQGKVEPGADKKSVVMKAGEMALKMYLKSHGAQQGGGSAASAAGESGGAGGLLSLAGKFLK